MNKPWCPCGAGCYGTVDGQCYPTPEAFHAREAEIWRDIYACLVRHLAALPDDWMRTQFLDGALRAGRDENVIRRLRIDVFNARMDAA